MKPPQCGEIMHSSQNTSEASSQNTSEDPKIGKTAGTCPDSTKTECSSLDIEEQFYPNLTAKNDCSDSPTAEDKQATDTTKGKIHAYIYIQAIYECTIHVALQ